MTNLDDAVRTKAAHTSISLYNLVDLPIRIPEAMTNPGGKIGSGQGMRQNSKIASLARIQIKEQTRSNRTGANVSRNRASCCCCGRMSSQNQNWTTNSKVMH